MSNSQMKSNQPTGFKKRDPKLMGIYSHSLITRHITLQITNIGKNIKATIEQYIKSNYEGKCVVEGFIKRDSTTVITYSSGLIRGTSIIFEVVFECDICCPVEGMLIQCIAKNITKAGIRAESASENPSPIVVFIARDHHFMKQNFSLIEEGNTFMARVIGQRFELNDKYVSIIAELVDPKPEYTNKPMTGNAKMPNKPKLVFEDA